MDISYEDFLKYLSERFNVPIHNIDRDTVFTEDLGVDSLALYNLIADVEKKYHIRLDVEDIISISTVGQVFDYVLGRTHGE